MFQALTGIRNIGNTCYLAAALQCLYRCSISTHLLLNGLPPSPAGAPPPLLSELNKAFTSYSQCQLVDPAGVHSALLDTRMRGMLPRLPPPLRQRLLLSMQHRQEDAQEALLLLLDQMGEEAKQALPAWHAQRFFDITVQSLLRCPECGHESSTQAVETMLTLPICPPEDSTLEHCIRNYLRAERLDDDNKCVCDGCHAKVNGIKQLTIAALPKYFLIALKRFNSQTGRKQKADIAMPTVLEIGARVYRLRCVVLHMGDVEGGHYMAISRVADGWHVCNDSSVQACAPAQLEQATRQGYIHLYVDETSAHADAHANN